MANIPMTSDNQQAKPSEPSLRHGETIKQRLNISEELPQGKLLTEKEFEQKQ